MFYGTIIQPNVVALLYKLYATLCLISTITTFISVVSKLVVDVTAT